MTFSCILETGIRINVTELTFRVGECSVQGCSVGDFPRLRGCPCAELGTTGRDLSRFSVRDFTVLIRGIPGSGVTTPQ